MSPELQKIAPVLLANGLVYVVSVIASTFSPAVYYAFGVADWLTTFRTYHWLVAPVFSLAGAVSIGYVGDRWAREPAIAMVLVLTGLSALAVAMIPSYYTGGTLTIVLYLLSHALFAFAVGSQFGPALAYLLESAPPDRAGFFVSLLGASSTIGSIVGVALIWLGLGQLNWRVAVGCGVLIMPMAFLLRSGAAGRNDKVSQPSGQRAYTWPLLLATTILLAFAVTSSMTSSTAIPQIEFRGFGSHPGFWTVINLVCAVVMCLAGWIYDRVGPRSVMLAAGVPLGLFALLSIVLMILLNYGLVSFVPLLVVTVFALLLKAAMFVPVPMAAAQLVSPAQRARTVNLVGVGASTLFALISGPSGRQMMNFEVMLQAIIWIAAIVAMFKLFPKPARA
jgi:MHS family alpha-ketoglutarate permease-like MFS transporter